MEAEPQNSLPASDTQPPAQVQMEFQKVQYNGQTLSARLLVGVVEGSLTLDKRLVENTSISVESVTRCDTEQPLEYLEVDRFPAPAQEKDLLVLKPGYWYGAEVSFPLFDPKLNGQSGPDCIEATLRFQAHGSKAPSASSRIRASQSGPDSVQGMNDRGTDSTMKPRAQACQVDTDDKADTPPFQTP